MLVIVGSESYDNSIIVFGLKFVTDISIRYFGINSILNKPSPQSRMFPAIAASSKYNVLLVHGGYSTENPVKLLKDFWVLNNLDRITSIPPDWSSLSWDNSPAAASHYFMMLTPSIFALVGADNSPRDVIIIDLDNMSAFVPTTNPNSIYKSWPSTLRRYSNYFILT